MDPRPCQYILQQLSHKVAYQGYAEIRNYHKQRSRIRIYTCTYLYVHVTETCPCRFRLAAVWLLLVYTQTKIGAYITIFIKAPLLHWTLPALWTLATKVWLLLSWTWSNNNFKKALQRIPHILFVPVAIVTCCFNQLPSTSGYRYKGK